MTFGSNDHKHEALGQVFDTCRECLDHYVRQWLTADGDTPPIDVLEEWDEDEIKHEMTYCERDACRVDMPCGALDEDVRDSLERVWEEIAAQVHWTAEVIADDSGQWAGNAMVFATRGEAEIYVEELKNRWFLVRNTRTVPTTDPVNYAIENGSVVHR